MKKLVAIILASALCLCLGACGSGNKPSTSEIEAKSPESLENATKQSDQNNSEQNKFLPLEIKEYGYAINKDYLFCAVILHNPNTEYAVEYPTFRITARDADGLVLGTEDQTLSIIYPQQDFYYAGLAFDVEQEPTTVDVEVVVPDEYNIIIPEKLEHPEYVPLVAKNSVVRGDNVLGEVYNNNDYDINQAIVTAVFKDENGKIVFGDSTFVDKIPASGSIPFDLSIDDELITENFEVYANIW